MKSENTCLNCGKQLQAGQEHKVFCSPRCAILYGDPLVLENADKLPDCDECKLGIDNRDRYCKVCVITYAFETG